MKRRFAIFALTVGCSTTVQQVPAESSPLPSDDPTGSEGSAADEDEPGRDADDSGSDAGVKTSARVGFRYHTGYGAPFATAADACIGSGYWGDRCGECVGGSYAPAVATIRRKGEPDIGLTDCAVQPTAAGPIDDVVYCCETPFIALAGPAASPKTCDDVCGAEGLKCTKIAPIRPGSGRILTGTGYLLYRSRSSSGSVRRDLVFSSCDYVPAPTMTESGDQYSLDEYTCTCVDPLSSVPNPP